jgi:hypothetical protein
MNHWIQRQNPVHFARHSSGPGQVVLSVEAKQSSFWWQRPVAQSASVVQSGQQLPHAQTCVAVRDA